MISIRQSEDVCVQPFNLAKAVTEKGMTDATVDFLAYVKPMMLHEPKDRVHVRIMEHAVRDFLCEAQRFADIRDLAMCVFDDYSFRDKPKGGTRVVYTGRNCLGDRKLTTYYDFQFKCQLLPTWAKQQIRDGLCMVSFSQGLPAHQTNLIFHLM